MTYEGDDKKLHPIRTISHGRVIQQGVVLEFSIETQSNNLTYH
jgi:hypothetical protein